MRSFLALTVCVCAVSTLAMLLPAPMFVNPAQGQTDNVIPQQTQRHALIIGNLNYRVGPLKNPLNDAQDIGNALRLLDFQVQTLENTKNRRELQEGIRQALRRVPKDSVLFFYYSGHGLEIKGQNYLIPTDFEGSEDELEYETVGLSWVLDALRDTRARLNIVVLDACRNNPYTRSHKSSSRGLAGITGSPVGMQIIYAADAGEVANDNPNQRNGLFTQEFLKALRTPGASVEQIFKVTGYQVSKKSSYKQNPAIYGKAYEDFYFTSPLLSTLPDDPRLLPTPRPTVYPDFLAPPLATAQPTLTSPSPSPTPQRPTVSLAAPAPQPTQKPQYYHDQRVLFNQLNMGFRRIPAGQFVMGSLANEQHRDADEQPHLVHLSRDYYLQTTEVTQKQWQAVMGTNIVEQRNKANPQWSLAGVGDEYPMYYVNWHEAQRFIQKLNQRGDGTYRLPTEAEWEYAARAGNTTPYHFGYHIEDLPIYGNFADKKVIGWNTVIDSWAHAQLDDGNRLTARVSYYKANDWGIYDMHGNLWEWVQDVYSPYPEGSVTNPQGPKEGEYRVFRGGSWRDPAHYARSADRYFDAPTYRSSSLGFRVVRNP
jgi:formylglycine-generating enzyme required for sulfatase activity